MLDQKCLKSASNPSLRIVCWNENWYFEMWFQTKSKPIRQGKDISVETWSTFIKLKSRQKLCYTESLVTAIVILNVNVSIVNEFKFTYAIADWKFEGCRFKMCY